MRHVGVALSIQEWEQLATRLRGAGVKFIIEPRIRFKGEVGEQATMPFPQPCGVARELRACANPSQFFAK